MEQHRNRCRWAALAALAVVVLPGLIVAPAAARAAVRVNVNLGAPPPFGPGFSREPRVVVVPGANCTFVPDFRDADVYCAGPWWYAYREGYWYRARGWRGPWVYVDVGYVPRTVFHTGPGYRHYRHMAASEWRREHGWENRERRGERREDRRDRREDRREERREDRRDRH
jgi:hypothetical protein